ncbi:MAG: DUF4412 domain-containing protein [Chitinophagaceae bacterium]
MKKLFFILMVLMLAQQAIAQRSQVHREVKNKVKEKQTAQYQDEREKGKQAVEERLDTWERQDKEFRAGIKPFPTASFKAQISYPQKPKNNMEIQYYFKQFDCVSVFKEKQSSSETTRMITNFKEGKSIILTTDKKGKKTGIEMDMKMAQGMVRSMAKKQTEQNQDHNIHFKATNEFKTISGYRCQKYIVEAEETKSNMWLSKDKFPFSFLDIGFAMANAFGGTQALSNAMYPKSTEGVLIQIEMYDKSQQEIESIITYSDFSNNAPAAMFGTDGYEIQKMPSMRSLWDQYKNEN